MEHTPMNDYLLIRLEDTDNKKEGELYFGEVKNKPKIGEILAFSKECKNKNFEVGKKVQIMKYDMIPNGDSEVEVFVSEKAIIDMY